MYGTEKKTLQEKLFRKVALDRLSSPEQLDQVVRVTTPAGWVALGALFLSLFTALLWGIIGSVPTTVIGAGILIKSGGVFVVSADAPGRLTDLAVVAGDVIKQGQKIARISQPELLDQFHSLKENYNELLKRREEQSEVIRLQQENLKASVVALKDKLEAQKELLEEGLITKQSVFATRQEMASSKNQIQQLDVRRLELDNEVSSALRNINSLKQKLSLSTEVVSPYTGRVLEIKADDGKVVTAGSSIINMELIGNSVKELEAVIYLSALDGKKVKPGMEVLIAPSTVRKEEYGMMRARVTQVAEFPATFQGMMRVLQNEQLVQDLTRTGAALEVHADLIPDVSTVSGYEWSSAGGSPVKIQSGTICETFITVRSQRPITLLLPFLKEFFGV